MTDTNEVAGAIGVQVINELEGISMGLKYFDDPNVVYVSPSVMEKIKGGNFELTFVVTRYRKSSKSMGEIAEQLIDDVIEYGKETGQI